MAELLIGCGHSREKKIAVDGRGEWSELVTLDIYPESGADVIHDLATLPYPFPDNTFDEIHAYDVLEHMGNQGDWRFFFDQFAELYRIIKPGGTFHCVSPHHSSPWAWGDPGHTRIIGLEQITFLDQKRCETPSAMTDYRWYYKADWELSWNMITEGMQTAFLLRARKPASSFAPQP